MQAITEKTLIPLGIIASLLAAAVGATTWMTALYSRVSVAEQRIQDVEATNKETIKELKLVNETLVEIKTILDKRGSR